MNETKKHKVVLFNKPWDIKNEIIDEPIIEGYELSTDHHYLEEAVAVVFHMPTLSKEEILAAANNKRDGQLWVFWSMECEEHYRWQYEYEIFNLFDIKATYKLKADIPVPYLYPHYATLLRKEPAPKTGLINAFISSSFNQSGRVTRLKELMSYLDVHSYGKLMNNKQLPGDEGPVTKMDIISTYKFTIAFENAIAMDYVTEKFFEPLVAGSVPVYLGAPNVSQFAPGDKCYIDVNDFSSTKALADFLLELDNSEEQYEAYLAWKKLPYKDSFTNNLNSVYKVHPIVQLCEMMRDGRYAVRASNLALNQ